MLEPRDKPVWQELAVIIVAVGVGLFVGAGIGAFVGSFFYTGEGDPLLAFTKNPDETSKISFLVMQGFTSLFGFFLVPLVAWSAFTKKTFKNLRGPWPSTHIWWLLPLLVIAFVVVDSPVIYWNMHLDLPDSAFEQWARAQEDQLAEITKLLTTFLSPWDFILAFVIVAIIAGITEEFLFRGLIQNAMHRGLGNPHLAIWFTAIIFSAIHVQFYGFVPRMLLGALFGYLYWWSGNIWIAIGAHMINNGFSLVMMYLAQLNQVEMDMENEIAPWPLIAIGAVLGVGILIYFYKHFRQVKQPSESLHA
jgi:membrane protease YdiL (CAAX protease family)